MWAQQKLFGQTEEDVLCRYEDIRKSSMVSEGKLSEPEYR